MENWLTNIFDEIELILIDQFNEVLKRDQFNGVHRGVVISK